MILSELHAKLTKLLENGWKNDEVRVTSLNGNKLNAEIDSVDVVDPPVPIRGWVNIIVDD